MEASFVENKNDKKTKKLRSFDKKNGQLVWWLMLLPGLIFTLIFKYGPMFGVIISFQEFGLGSTSFFGNPWVGFDNFTYAFDESKNTEKIVMIWCIPHGAWIAFPIRYILDIYLST